MSDPKNTEISKKFSKREWIHLIITLSIIQGIIWYVSHIHSTNASALGYVSFAGTLISIILAVLAIGYTYGESQQQKNSSATLANQIDSLIDIKEKLEIQADALQGIRLLEENFQNFSKLVDSRFLETQQQVHLINQGVSFLANNSSNSISSANINSNLASVFQFAKGFDNYYHHLNYCLIAIFLDREFKKNIHTTFDEFNIILNELNFDYFSISLSRDLILGGCIASCNHLSFLGAYNYQVNYIDPSLVDYFKFCAEKINSMNVVGNNSIVFPQLYNQVINLDILKN